MFSPKKIHFLCTKSGKFIVTRSAIASPGFCKVNATISNPKVNSQ